MGLFRQALAVSAVLLAIAPSSLVLATEPLASDWPNQTTLVAASSWPSQVGSDVSMLPLAMTSPVFLARSVLVLVAWFGLAVGLGTALMATVVLAWRFCRRGQASCPGAAASQRPVLLRLPRSDPQEEIGSANSQGSQRRRSASARSSCRRGLFLQSRVAEQERWALGALQLELGVSFEEISAAYRRLAKLYHPDRVAHLAPELRRVADERMKEINRAFAILKAQTAIAA